VKLDDPKLSEHAWLLDAVRDGLAQLHTTELATFPMEAADGTLERLLIATELGLVEGTLSGPPIEGMPGLVLDLRLWRDVPVSARARVDTQHGAHGARASLTIGERVVSSWSLPTRQAADEFIGEVLAQARRVGRP